MPLPKLERAVLDKLPSSWRVNPETTHFLWCGGKYPARGLPEFELAPSWWTPELCRKLIQPTPSVVETRNTIIGRYAAEMCVYLVEREGFAGYLERLLANRTLVCMCPMNIMCHVDALIHIAHTYLPGWNPEQRIIRPTLAIPDSHLSADRWIEKHIESYKR